MHSGTVGKVVNDQPQLSDWSNRDNWSSEDKNAAGNRIYITGDINGENVQTGYWHLSSVATNPLTGETLKPGDTVQKGMLIGYAGSTGNASAQGSSGPHLHLRVMKSGKGVNPENYLITKFGKNGTAK